MRQKALTKEDKAKLEKLLAELQILPPSAGQVMLSIDTQGKVGSVELRAVWR